jgi:hypothetical protein
MVSYLFVLTRFFCKNNHYLLHQPNLFEKETKTNKLNYDQIGQLKSEQDRLIVQGKMQKPEMTVGFTPEERKMFDNGIPMETLFERVFEQSTV